MCPLNYRSSAAPDMTNRDTHIIPKNLPIISFLYSQNVSSIILKVLEEFEVKPVAGSQFLGGGGHD